MTDAATAARRRADRAEPRLGVALAGAGCMLAVAGVLVLAFDGLGGGDGGGGSQLPGVFLSLAVLVGGLLLLTKAPAGPLHTAGSVATVAAVPPLVFFVTFDDGSFPPYSTEAIFAVSAAAWLALHFLGPAAGRPFPLGSGLVALWLFVLQVIEKPFTAPFDILGLFAFTVTLDEGTFGRGGELGEVVDPFDRGSGAGFGRGFDVPDLETMAAISLVFGAALVIIGRLLDRRGQRGQATPVAGASLPMLVLGALLLVPDDGAVAGGLVLAAAGGWLAYEGGSRNRRLTGWAGALAVVVGAGMVIGDLVGDTATGFGVGAIVVGAAVVVAGHVLAERLKEPDELYVSGGSTQPSAPPLEPPDPPVAGGWVE